VDSAVKEALEAKEGMKKVESKVTAFEGDISELRSEMAAWKAEVEDKITQNEFKDPMPEEPAQDRKVHDKIKEIEMKIAGMKSAGPVHGEILAPTLFFGGFGVESGGQPALDWVDAQIKETKMAVPESIYFKGGDFKGYVIAKFRNGEDAKKTMDAINKNQLKFEGHEVRCKPDAPVHVRVVRSLLLGLRWQLGEWGFNKKVIDVDVSSSIMTVEKKPVATAVIDGKKLSISWHDPTWNEWQELHSSVEMKGLLDAGNKKLQQLSEIEGIGKGKGFGKSV
jgi:hypothetical protein